MFLQLCVGQFGGNMYLATVGLFVYISHVGMHCFPDISSKWSGRDRTCCYHRHRSSRCRSRSFSSSSGVAEQQTCVQRWKVIRQS
jgi:hypothetical protein